MPELLKNVTGIILSGGASSRMKTNKSLLKLDSATVIERTKNLLASVFENVMLSTNDFDSFRFLGIAMVEDIFKDHGPLGGIHASLNSSPTDKNFVISCDLPFITEDLIRYMAGYNSSGQMIIPTAGGKAQQLCGIYHKSLIGPIWEILLDAENSKREGVKSAASIRKLMQNCQTEIVEVDSLPFYNQDLFFNMNCAEDYEIAKTKVPG